MLTDLHRGHDDSHGPKTCFVTRVLLNFSPGLSDDISRSDKAEEHLRAQ